MQELSNNTECPSKIVYLMFKFTNRICCSCCKRSELSPGFCLLKAPCWLKKKNFPVPRLVNVFWCL